MHGLVVFSMSAAALARSQENKKTHKGDLYRSLLASSGCFVSVPSAVCAAQKPSKALFYRGSTVGKMNKGANVAHGLCKSRQQHAEGGL